MTRAYEEYTGRRERWQAVRSQQEKLFVAIGNWRLVLGMAEAILAYLVFSSHLLPSWTLVLPMAAFVVLAVWHSRVLRVKTLALRALAFYDRCLARLDDRWADAGSTGEGFRDPGHLYADDLDLFGKGSLFQMLSNTRTRAGEEMLAQWLLAPAGHHEVMERQAAVQELTGRLDLREQIALLGSDVQSTLNIQAMERWGLAPAVHFPGWLRWIAPVLALVSIGCILGFFAQAVEFWQLATVCGLDFVVIVALRSRVDAVLEAAEMPGHGLPVFSSLLECLQQERFESPYLRRLSGLLTVEGRSASARIRDLARWIDWLDSSDHLLVKAIRPLVLWREQIAMGIEAWKRHSGLQIAGWLRAVAEFEAISSLASLAYEHPQWAYPQLTPEGVVFRAEALRHPLLPFARCVPNDVRLDQETQLLIVSGSNMSGKSTLLRAAGLNCVLAWAGAPVAAEGLLLSPLQPGASIRVTDSLLDNRSRFMAEISRLRQVVEVAGQGRPVLFLFDEILSGTNSHDRRIGAAAIVKKLVRDGAIGFITTHDLALAEIQTELGTVARNVHFDDRIEDGQIRFEYRLRQGVVTHSNALELMRAIGLDV